LERKLHGCSSIQPVAWQSCHTAAEAFLPRMASMRRLNILLLQLALFLQSNACELPMASQFHAACCGGRHAFYGTHT
jgi:hypothetical protein